MLTTPLLGLAYGASEIALALRKRARRAGARSADGGTLRAVWIVIALSFAAAAATATRCTWGRYELGRAAQIASLATLLAGVALRWWAIAVLGRFFTVDVAIHREHELVRRGPYRVLRHPSYTGVLLAFAGIGASFGSGPALALLVLPVFAVLVWRIRVEERALEQNFGAAWSAHARATWRLVPYLW